ncbi:MAG TPA: molybdopterin cofactor-binding domain-containing protein, partial [Bryobacteraceae bacterium]|nr:molybdopterin cofactor-binding domain-containing protein [Bryobacteraceae bacterium]
MFHTVGKPVLRKEAHAKVTGAAKYVDDFSLPGMLYGVTVRSPVARGRIRNIEFLPGIPWDEFIIVTAKDIPGENCVALIVDDQPYLAAEYVNHPEEPVVLLAHPNKYLTEKARGAVRLDIEPMPAIFTLEDALAKKEIVWGDDNVFKTFLVEKGNVDVAWSDAAHLVEGEYRTGAQEQLYIETNGVVARANPEDGITIWGSMQCPYYVHKALL